MFIMAVDRVKVCGVSDLEVISVKSCHVKRAWGQRKKRWVESCVGWLHSVQLGELMIFMWNSLLLVMQQFLSTLYWRSLASIALDV